MDELVEFCEAHPWRPLWPAPMIRRFLTTLVSSRELVLKVVEDGELVA